MILVCPVSFKRFLLTLMAGATVMAQQPSTSPSTSAMPSTSGAPSYSPSTSHSPSYSPSMSPSNAPSQTCMVYANGTAYTAADFASMKSGTTFDAATSTLTCSDGSLVGRAPFTYLGSCVGIEVENCKELDCEHEFSCYNVTTTNVPTVKCDGSGACRQAKIQSPTFLECEGHNACTLASVSLPNSAKMDCTDGGCIRANVNPTGTGEGILMTCKGGYPSCTGSHINVGKGRIQCAVTAPVTGSFYICTSAHYRADCLQCEDIRSCGGSCVLQTATQNISCASPEPNTYGTCDNVPTGSPTLSSAPSLSAAPTGEASCKVTASSGSVFSAQRFAEAYPGVTYSAPSGVETLSCFQTIRNPNTVSCNNITVTGCGVLECNGKRTCLRIKTMDVDEVDCEGEEACKDAQISSPEHVLCEGKNSCAGASVSDVKKLVDCRALESGSRIRALSPCSGMNVKSSRQNATLDCDGLTACDSNLNADLSQGNVICTGVLVNPTISAAACQDVNISAVCLECRGNEGTGCGSGCEFTTTDGTSSSSCASSTIAQFGSCPSRTSGASIREAIGALTGSIALILSLMFL